ncbi:hypothetical protein GUJ93_ZPchr0006g46158 [Zizania palustris]|uniref:Uncharacterized protein n=1 Tax=Zizania palustris TaxID=103762 RepID=A0A8J5SD61_ZIZPA|nr:hypothetical protein GUJ93_ZPchr0006g46158 [Zizania palustris]
MNCWSIVEPRGDTRKGSLALRAKQGDDFQDKTFVYDFNSTTILEEIETVPNTKGLCAFSPSSEACYLSIPASTSKGSALAYKASEPELICQRPDTRRQQHKFGASLNKKNTPFVDWNND